MGSLGKIFVWGIAALLVLLRETCGFAYAPNFITKIVQEQTGIKPTGLLEIESKDDSSDDDDTSSNNKIDRPVTTRFPPEPNGYLHLGHAKAVCFNFAVSRMFGGNCNMRMDDTNPSKEDEEYVESILRDVKWIQSGLFEGDKPWDGEVRKTSDYFDVIYDAAVALIKQGDAYVDSLSAEEMREYRGTLTEPGKDSPHRSRSIEENLELFEGMRDGKFKEGEHVLRAKIDMSSPNINMRDPALYRIKHESHQETGDKWCIYPMYDFSHPISDALEGITHSLCTLEFEDHRPFYDWTVEKLLPSGLITQVPQQIEFSRLNVKSTVLSKRKLIQLVEQKHVNGWDDPRMPTMSGLRRRGVPPAALRMFCERVGISKADSNIDAVVLEDCVREVMDDTCLRAFSVLKPLKVTITNWQGDDLEDFEVPRHPKREEMGTRTIPFGKTVYIERDDFFDLEGPEGKANDNRPPRGFKRLLPNQMVRLRYAYVIQCNEIVRDPETQEPIELKCEYFPDTRAGVTPEGMARVKGIIHWVEASKGQRCSVNQYDRLFLAEEPGKESGDFLKDINPKSLEVLTDVVIEPSVVEDAVKAMEEDASSISSLAYQFERSGYFALDESSTDASNLVFNRVVTLRDTWGAPKQGGRGGQRNRGSGQKSNQQPKGGAGTVEDVRRVAFRAATILSAEPHPEADSLLVCSVDCGDITEDGQSEPRTVVAGLAGKIPLDELVGRKVVAVTNLKPAKMRGIESGAMLLAASNESDEVELLTVPDAVPNGELISFDGKQPSEPDVMLKSKGAQKVWERVKSSLRASDSGEALYLQEGEAHKMITSEGVFTDKTRALSR
ncbi:Glutamine--tRNA ligase [Seminavis robusta]|uniref:glutamine--tRNA ligase n=1 Tax=Seminavis robusta TaxID=568900 RepID=A0A9N8DG83_9STRA|nr:Glutamine--tRNA ligase [Seminavis robusta]|eukprot:Sro110_g054990.1 Glutamine--tRNA ligase (837) ;mRNA; r:83804-86599